MTSLSFTIEAEPVPASRPQVSVRGVFYPRKHMAYKGFLDTVLKEVQALAFVGAVELRLLFVMPRYKASESPVHRSDVDNLSKLPMDCMTKCMTEDGTPRFWKDDNLVVHLSASKRFAREGEEPHTKVKIIPIEGSIEDHVDKVFNQ